MYLFNKNFNCLFLAQLFTHFSDATIQIVLMYVLINTIQNSSSAIALLIFSFILPSLVISPIAGSIVDRFSRKKIMFISSIYRAYIVLSFLLFYLCTLSKNIFIKNVEFSSIILMFLIGIGTAFYYPAKMACVPNVVNAKNLKPANALISGSGALALTFGAIISSFILLKIGAINTTILSIGIYVLSAMLILPFSIKNSHLTSKINFIYDTKKTLCFLDKHKKALNMIFLAVMLSLISAIFYSAMNSLAIDTYQLNVDGLSKLKAMLGEGTIIGFFIMLILGKKLKTNKTLVFSFLGAFICLTTASFCTTFLRANIWLIGIGIFATLLKVTIDTILQKVSPDYIRGKIFAFASILETFATLLGTIVVSILSGIIKPIQIFHIAAFLPALSALLILIFNKEFRYFILRITLGQIFKCCFKYRFEGIENIPKDGKIILAGNHTGHLDPLIIQMATKRNLWFVTGPAAFKMPVIRHLLKWFNVLPLQFGKGIEAINSAITKLNKGEAVIIFPEGKFTSDGSLEKFHKGVALMAREANCPIIPFAIRGGFEAWGKLRRNPKLFTTIVIQFGQKMDDLSKSDNEIISELKERVMFMKRSLDRRVFYKISHKLHSNFLDIMQEKGDDFASVKALSIKTKDGYSELTYNEISRRAKTYANYLIENNKIQRNDRVAIICESRPEFSIAMFASIQTGAITVPLDIKLTVNEHTHILNDCNPRILICSSHYLKHAIEVKNNVKSIEEIYVLDKDEEITDNAILVSDLKSDISKNIGLPRSLDETALIVYTSGTTGNPKGVMISFGNIYSQLRDFEEVLNLTSKNTLLSILPLNHLLELNCGFFGMLYMGAKVVYIKSLNPKELVSTMKEKQITNMIVVPLVAKMLKNSIEKQIKKQNQFAQNVFNIMYKIAKYTPRYVRRIMFKSIIDGLGGKFECFVCGGAPLEDSVAEFFFRIGIPVFQGYGLTETSPTISTNSYKHNKIGTVGVAMPSVKVKLNDNGEILATGPNVMQGYYNKPDMTKEVIDEQGWFHTGDIGEIDKQGFIKITGRIKNMIVLGGGKKIFPEEVEAVLENSPLVKEVCVMSLIIKSGNKKGTEEVGAIIVPSDTLAKKTDIEIQKELEAEVKKLSKENLAPYKEPTVVVMRREEMPKTSTKKVKRKELLNWYENMEELDKE